MKTCIVLAMHGAPPNDFPRQELSEFFSLHSRLEHSRSLDIDTLRRRHAELEKKIREWPRTAQNDPYHSAAFTLARQLQLAAEQPVFVGFNEFCAPTLDEALDQAASKTVQRIVVVTPMMTRGGGHSEKEIPTAVQRAKERHPNIHFLYAWPFDEADIARFLYLQILGFLERE